MTILGWLGGIISEHLLESKIEITGGLMLIGIGLKILIEHLFFLK
ncbi:MAG TPA: hypothetical protein VHP36_02020 [Chitinispirillaceae bacterium]|nr:hypothetical protein [Chitinispirillaceae bacterium]